MAVEKQLYHNITLTPETIKRRRQIKQLQDEFMTFSWNGFDAFDSFGAFIINENKGSLKFYNGPQFQNTYTAPQFDQAGGSLMGVNFQKQTIEFTIGVYWISAAHYRLMMNWLNPLEVGDLIFGFDRNWRYNVKLAKVADSIRYIVGREFLEDGTNEPMYYTEFSLSFEIQGTACAKGVHSYEFNAWREPDKNDHSIYTTNINITKEFIESNLPTPLDIPFTFTPVNQTNNDNLYYHIQLDAFYKAPDEKQPQTLQLFSITLHNLTHVQNSLPYALNIRYNSETGLLFLKYGNSDERLLNLLNLTDTGEKIVYSFTSNKFFLPGNFNFPNFDSNNFKLQLTIKTSLGDDEFNAPGDNFFDKNNCEYSAKGIICYPRTNLI